MLPWHHECQFKTTWNFNPNIFGVFINVYFRPKDLIIQCILWYDQTLLHTSVACAIGPNENLKIFNFDLVECVLNF